MSAHEGGTPFRSGNAGVPRCRSLSSSAVGVALDEAVLVERGNIFSYLMKVGCLQPAGTPTVMKAVVETSLSMNKLIALRSAAGICS